MTLDSQTVEGELVNISLHGALVTSKKLLDLHSCVVVNIFDKASSRSITGVKAKVVRVTANSMALAFEKAEHPAPNPRN